MAQNVADILIESLPYIRKFYGETIVIKYGGHAMVDEDLKMNFARDISLLKFVGFNPVVVHGGGPQINRVLERMNIKTNFIEGLRFTDEETMDVVEMVLVGKVNKEIVAEINKHGGKAVGLSGKDGQLILAEKMKIVKKTDSNAPEIIDTGLVGKVTHINKDIINTISKEQFIPIIAPVGTGKNGETYNINADYVASQIATVLDAKKLILLTDVDGVLNDKKELISSLDAKNIKKLIKDKTIKEGMIPKIQCALDFLKSTNQKVHIINGKRPHAILLELFTNDGIGTEITL